MWIKWAAAAGVIWASVAVAQTPPQAEPGRRASPGAIVSMEVAWSPKAAAKQQRALAKALDGLAPQRPGQRDVYVLAAGLWSDPVFDREAGAAAEILSTRYKAAGRTVVLGNGAEAIAAGRPAATALHLQAALGRIGERMDPKEDALIVFITTHGDEKGAALNEDMRMRALLTPQALRASLDDIGVENRIVIVSACHSGVFVEPLKTPTTLVITAAAPEMKSFGCRPENQWTYFGDAFFNQSLSRGKGLVQAFEDAKLLVGLWERRDRETPSEPQIYVGERASKILAEIE
jgi:hypothetical protein